MGRIFPFHHRGCRLAFPKARAQPKFHDPIVVGQRAHRFLVLPNARCGQGFHSADDGLEISGAADLPAQALDRLAHDFSLASAVGCVAASDFRGRPPSDSDLASGLGVASALSSGLGWKGASAWRAISMIVLRSLSLSLSVFSKRAHTSAGMFAAAF